MGCGASRAVQPDPAVLVAEKAAAEKAAAEKAAQEKAAVEKAPAEFERQLAKARAAQAANTNAALRFGQQFELTTPMLVMPFGVFKAQGRIMKSTKAWRDEALAAGSLVVHEEGSGQIVIFISHTWWDRSFRDATNDPNNPYDVGAPDLQADYADEQREMIVDCNEYGELQYEMVTYQRPKNLKWRVICAGVQRLLEQEGLKEEDVSLWVDWQSIYQDDEAEKLKGVASLIRYATLCQYMLVPTEEAKLRDFGQLPNRIPAYGDRGWCRIEHFVFSLLAEMRGQQVQLYGIARDGALHRYPEVAVLVESDMPSGGDLSNPDDQALVKGLEDKMIDVYGSAIVEVKCKAARRGERVDLNLKMLRPQHVGVLFAAVDLNLKMLRPQHVGALFAAVERYQVTELNLRHNQLGAEGGALVAAALKTNTTLTKLELDDNKLGPEGGMALAEALKSNTTLKWLGLDCNDLGPEGGMALAEALKSNTTLERLGLGGNDLGRAAERALRAAASSDLHVHIM